MVLIGSVKYACERCIRGHRVTTCNHTDQPLMMIKPKGRPSSQCKHCKELRKTKNSHPSGACTCGKNKKISSTNSSGAIHKCSCKTGEPCQCHSRRKKTDSRSNLSQTKPPSEDISSPSLANHGSNPSLNPSSSASFNWRNNSYSSSSQTPQSKSTPSTTQQQQQQSQQQQQQSQQQQQDQRVRQIGMDPLTNAKPISDSTRTRVGEVSVPINEYIPHNSNGIGNVNDKMPDVFFQDVPLPFEPGHGLLDLFANNNNVTSVNPYFHEDPRHDLPTKHNQQQQYNKIRSPSEASASTNNGSINYSQSNGFNNNSNNNNFNQMTSPDKYSNNNNNNNSNQHFPHQNFQRTDSAMSLSSMGSNSQMSRVNASSDSLASGNNYHHYDNMIHKQNNQVHSNQQYNGYTNGNNNNNQSSNNDDTASIQSVEVLSLTPSFMDILTDFNNEKGYFSNNHNDQSTSQNQQNQQQNETYRNHRFTPSIDSMQSGQSGKRNSGINLNFDQSSTIPQIHSNLINNTETSSELDTDVLGGDDLNIPRELTKTNSEESNFTDNSLFNNFNTKLTTSGL